MTITITKDQLQEALRRWEQDAREGRTLTEAQHRAKPLDQAVADSTEHLWDELIAGGNAAEPQAQFDLPAHLQRQKAFSEHTFGPGERVKAVCDHIRKELIEVEDAATAGQPTLKEWIDVVILGLDGAWRSGATPEQIIDALVRKQAVNEARTWPDWRTADPEKAIEHDRSGEAQGGHVMDPMRAKLKQARAEIEAVMKKHDIAGFVTLHAPGWGETFWNIWPSYSILTGDFPAIRIKSKLEDYQGDVTRQREDRAHTAQMIHALARPMAECGMQFLSLSEILIAKLEAQHVDGPCFPEPSKLNPGAH